MRTFLSHEAEETANFIEKFDKFFDMLNVSNYFSTYKSLKPFKAPYRWSADKRLQVSRSSHIVTCIAYTKYLCIL